MGSCLIAFKATDSGQHADTALIYFNALLDDKTTVGDAMGGDTVVRSDSGYYMRVYAPYTAVAYDWLHDYSGTGSTLLSHARDRFDAWFTWYNSSGYHANDAGGSNYYAGYLYAVTLGAIAMSGEGGAVSQKWWDQVVDVVWGQQMIPAAEEGGVLVGGDWPEGWQYGPLSVWEYSMASRAMEGVGIRTGNVPQYVTDLLWRHMYAMTPVTSDIFVGGDTESEVPKYHCQSSHYARSMFLFLVTSSSWPRSRSGTVPQ